MGVSLGTTLINKGIKTLVKYGGWQRIEDGYTNGTDIFIGAAVAVAGETKPDIDLCAEIEAIWGFVLGYNKAENEIDSQGYYYRDYDNCFGDGKWVLVGIPKHNSVYLVLSATYETIHRGFKVKCVDGVFEEADTDDNYQMIAEQGVTGAASTRKYFWAKWVKN